MQTRIPVRVPRIAALLFGLRYDYGACILDVFLPPDVHLHLEISSAPLAVPPTPTHSKLALRVVASLLFPSCRIVVLKASAPQNFPSEISNGS